MPDLLRGPPSSSTSEEELEDPAFDETTGDPSSVQTGEGSGATNPSSVVYSSWPIGCAGGASGDGSGPLPSSLLTEVKFQESQHSLSVELL